MDYQNIGKTLETLGKELQKLNNKLDKVLEKLLEVETFEERKAEAVSLIEGDQISDAINLLKVLEKDQAKAEDLKQEETSLREQLEAMRLEAEQAVAGNTAEESERPLKSVDAA